MMHLDRARFEDWGFTDPPASARDWTVLLGSAALAPFVVRAALLVDAAIVPAGADLRGVLADAAASLIFAGALAAM